MATTSSRHRIEGESFDIHEDDIREEEPRAEYARMEAEYTDSREATPERDEAQEEEDEDERDEQLEEAMDPEDDDEENQDDRDNRDESDSDSSDENEPIDVTTQGDIAKLQRTFPSLKHHYRLIKRIGEGTFSTVYKAEDLRYDHYDNRWDLDAKDQQWMPPPLRTASSSRSNSTARSQRRKPRFVAIKKIYVTSSPARILNELELLHDLRGSEAVCPLITAFRQADQIIAILPYSRHQDFRKYYPDMTVYDMRIYFKSLFTGMAAVHRRGIIHRDIKPTNFLYDPDKRRGVLVDFGLAEREGTDCKPCLCREDRAVRKQRLQQSVAFNTAPPSQPGYPKSDPRPSRRANRAGTRGFRAPEVLFKCTEQTPKIDVWSAGVILLTILCRRFPFFNSADDVEAMIEIATIFGVKRMKQAGQLHGCMFDTSIPTIGKEGFSFEKIMLWSTCRSDGGRDGAANSNNNATLTSEEREAIAFLRACLELDPARRISAADALAHDFLQVDVDGDEPEGDAEDDQDDQVMML
ncbi:kinase-like domain-containing protein [Xylariaceae sp. FL0804]|nr:kinase-like domain-containing protein [Xylariaceae sp. FL0804]